MSDLRSQAGTGGLPVHLTSYIGRQHQMAELVRLLDRARLLTLTGAGGVGKTRLALRTAAQVADHYPEGLWVVELASLRDPALIVAEVAATVGVREQKAQTLIDSLQEFLRPRRALLILDNCEHLVDACARLIEGLLRSCPQLQIIATSREPLKAEGETAWRVPSMELPALHQSASLEYVAGCEAVKLFVERATSALATFRLTEQNAAAVGQICHQLDGIPLALELAAARITALSAEQIAVRLGDLFRVLTAGSRTTLPRQQTLRAAVDWSYELLSESERQLFDRLSVFAGGWTLEAAEAIGAGQAVCEDDVLDLLAHLVDKSMVLAEEHGAALRYRLLEPMRQYGAEQLRTRQEEAAVCGRHLRWFVRLAAQGDRQLRGADQQHWLDQLEAEHDNLRQALAWASHQEDETEAELELCSSLAVFWYLRDHIPEGRERLERALSRPSPSKAARMRALAGAGWLAHFQRDQVTARAWINESLALADERGDVWGRAWALHLLGRTYYFDNDAATARELGEQSLAAAQAVRDPWLEAWAMHLLGIAAYIAGDYPAARTFEEHSVRLRREIGDEANALVPIFWMGLGAHREGDYTRASAHYSEFLKGSYRLGFRFHFGQAYAVLSALAAEMGWPERAVLLAGALSRQMENIGTPPIPPVQRFLEEALEPARRTLSTESYAAAWSRGVAMPDDEVIAEAMAVGQFVSDQLATQSGQNLASALRPPRTSQVRPPQSPAPDTRPAPVAGLTQRELEILRLVAVGKSSSQIAADLVLSVRTVDRHLSNVYGKLDVRTRAQAAAYAYTHSLMDAD